MNYNSSTLHREYRSTKIIIISIVQVHGVYIASMPGKPYCGTGDTEDEALLELAMEHTARLA